MLPRRPARVHAMKQLRSQSFRGANGCRCAPHRPQELQQLGRWRGSQRVLSTATSSAGSRQAELAALEGRLRYRFRDRSLLDAALTHTSLLNERQQQQPTTASVTRTEVTRERLEFLGDAALGLAVALHLLDAFPDAQPHDLTVDRQEKVNNSYLSTVAADLMLDTCIHAAKNTPINSRSNADSVEAILGAIFVDSGQDLSQVTRFVKMHILRDPALAMDAIDNTSRLEDSLSAFIRSQLMSRPAVARAKPGKVVKEWQAALDNRAEESDLTAHLHGDKLSALGQLVSVLRERILNEQRPASADGDPGDSPVPCELARLRQKRQRPLNALIVGASSGIGAALARRLSTRGNHISLCLAGRRLPALEAVAEACRSQGANVSVVAGDVGSEADVVRISSHFADTMRDSSAFPVAILNAGVGAPSATTQVSAASCDTVLGTNVTGVILALRELLPLLSRAPASQVVVTGSVLGLRPPSSGGNVVYTASKHAIEGVVDAVRNEFAGTGVKVGVVNPGGVRTDWFDDPCKGGYSTENRPDTSRFLHVDEVVDAMLAVIDQDATTDIRRIVLENHAPK